MACLIGNSLENVCVAVPASERGKPPIKRNSRNHTIVIVESVVGCAVQRSWNRTSKQNSVDVVMVYP
jgi:hypothetical protein